MTFKSRAIVTSVFLALTMASSSSAIAELSESDLAGAVTILTIDSQGSGFFVSNTELMTAAHVVGNAREVRVRNRDGVTEEAGQVSVVSKECDVATITLNLQERDIFSLSDVPAKSGDTVFAIGSPIGRPVLSVGKVDAVDPIYVTTSVPVDSGSSGGPLITSDRQVVGVVVRKNELGNAIAVPIAKASECLEAAKDLRVITPTPLIQYSGSLAISIIAILISILALFVSTITLIRLREKRKPIVITLPTEQANER